MSRDLGAVAHQPCTDQSGRGRGAAQSGGGSGTGVSQPQRSGTKPRAPHRRRPGPGGLPFLEWAWSGDRYERTFMRPILPDNLVGQGKTRAVSSAPS